MFEPGDRVMVNYKEGLSGLQGLTGRISRVVYWDKEAYVSFDDKTALKAAIRTEVDQLLPVSWLEKIS